MADASSKTKSGDRSRLWDWLGAWQPVTGGGVAAFGRSSFARLFFFQLLTASASALVLLWCLQFAWVPVVDTALTRLPAQARVHHGRLEWPDAEAITLADSPQLGIGVTPLGSGEPNRTADLQLELDSGGVRLWGILGFHEWPYPPDADWALGRLEATALWAAWLWPLRLLTGLAAGATLLVAWWCLEAILSPGLWILGLIFRRDVPFGAAWRIAGASWLTATLVLDMTLLGYARRILTLPGVAVGLTVAVLVGLIWPIWGVLVSPAGRSTAGVADTKNPFSVEKKRESKPKPAEKPEREAEK